MGRSGNTTGTRRAAALLLSLSMIFGTGCGSDTSTETSAETAAPVETTPEATPEAESRYSGQIRISEVMTKNRTTLRDENGAFPDWIELENVSDDNINIEGFTLSDAEDETGWALPSVTLAPGELLLVYADGEDIRSDTLHTDFSLSKDETLSLRDAGGALVDSVSCTSDSADQALARNEEGEWELTYFSTPGYPNTADGYDARQSALEAPYPLMISEVVTANTGSTGADIPDECDWVEIKNVSSAPVELSEYYLSDDHDNYQLWNFPDKTLGAGESIIILCSADSVDSGTKYSIAPFGLDNDGEQLFLSDSSGNIIDYATLHDIPTGGSMGRMSGQNGWFYFSTPQPAKEKQGGARRVSAMPECLGGDGVYNDVESVTVELSAVGEIYYTLDGSVPSSDSTRYDGSITLTETTIVKAAAIENGALKSDTLNLSFIINEGHTLPVVSLVADDTTAFSRMYGNGRKDMELSGSLTYFSDDGSFSIPCGIDMHGETSLSQPRKNMGLHFRSRYGQSTLSYDLFGGGVTEFKSLILRAGQDQASTIIRNELLENLCLQFSDSVPTQRNIYCVLYVNGEYNGIYALMEKLNEQYYARFMDVSTDSVTVMKAWAPTDSEYYEQVIRFAQNNDLTTAEAYSEFCEIVDIDCLIDWMIIEGYSANTDLSTSNLRYAHSTEGDGKWRFMLYDLDATLTAPACIFANVLKPASTQSAAFITPLLKNSEFRDRFLTRAAEVLSTTLSNENVDAEIVRLTELIAPEAERSLKINKQTLVQWQANVQDLRTRIVGGDWNSRCIRAIKQYMNLSADEMQKYFGW